MSPEAADLVIAAAPDAIVSVQRDGTIAMANAAAARLFGYDEAALIGMSIDQLVPESSRPAHRAHRTRYSAKPRIRQMGDPGARLSAQRADGSLIPVEIALSPAKVGDDQLVVAIIRNVSDRLALEAAQESIRASLDAVDDAVFMFDPESLEFSYANAGATAQTGYERAELLDGMTPLHVKPLFDEPTFRRLLAPLLDGTQNALTFETVHRSKSGEDVPVEISLSYPETGQHLQRSMVALTRDIRERKAAEQRLRASEEAFRSAFDDAAVPMAIVDIDQPTRLILQANQALADMLGCSLEELVGTGMESLTQVTDPSDAGWPEPAEERGNYETVKRYRRSDGTYRWGALHASLLVGPEGQRRSLAHIVDITRQVEAETARDRREDLLGSLAMIRKATRDDESLDEVLRIIVRRANISLAGSHCVVATPIDRDTMLCRAMDSINQPDRTGESWATTEEFARIMASGETQSFTDTSDEIRLCLGPGASDLGPTIVAPLVTSASTVGVLVVSRSADAPPFDDDDLAAANALASEAAITMDLLKARVDRQRMFLAEDRERIARDLHDLVIQQLFATGMRLQAASNNPELLQDRVGETVEQLDETIGVIRQTIFHLTRPDDSLSGQIERLVDRHRAVGRNDVNLDVTGDLGSVSKRLYDHLLPTLNELLSNVERHAAASRADVHVQVTSTTVTVEVVDNGKGIDLQDSRGFGLSNLAKRAAVLGGELTHESGTDGAGTRVSWSVPLALQAEG